MYIGDSYTSLISPSGPNGRPGRPGRPVIPPGRGPGGPGGGPGGGGGDPLFSDTLLLLHGQGANGGTIFTDSSTYARTVSRFISGGTLETRTDQFKWGNSSIYGLNTAVLFFSVGAEASGVDWTWESWVRRNTSFAHFGLFNPKTATGGWIRIDGTAYGSTYKLQYLEGATIIQSTSAIPANTWTHLAISSQSLGGSSFRLRLFVDGTLNATLDSTNTNLKLYPNETYRIGETGPTQIVGMSGWIQDWRLTKACRYTASFTPPTAQFPDS